jgi:hypothetical protein
LGTVLITACPRDSPTRFGYFYLRKAADTLAGYGHRVVFLRSANLSNFRAALIKYNPRLVILNGHGGSRSVTGCSGEVILGVAGYDPELRKNITKENPSWMRGRIVFLFTCNAGKDIAPRLIEEGALAVVGYKTDYVFLSDDESPARSQKSKPFFFAPIMFPVILAMGGSVGEAVGEVKGAYRKYIAEADLNGDDLVAKYLYYDLENMVAYGKMNVTL